MTVRGRVTDGRLLVDEPTDLPEGAEVELSLVDDDLPDHVLTPDEEQGLMTALDSLRASEGVAHDVARERLLQRARR